MTNAKNTSRWATVAGLTGITGIAALSYYALRIEPLQVELTYPELFLSRLPSALSGLKILFIADMHTEDWTVREERIERLTASLSRPDLIVWGGDYLRRRAGIPAALRLVGSIMGQFPGVPSYAILGNAEHKLMLSEQKRLCDAIGALGVTVLRNESRELMVRGESITLVSVDDPYYGFADLDLALAGRTVAQTGFTLLLAHSPQIVTQAARAGIDLMLSGHTHGGQVRLPVIGPLKTQNPLCRRVDMGIFDRARLTRTLGYDPGGDLTLYITRGIGLANLPRMAWAAPRFLCRPEVSLITLRAR